MDDFMSHSNATNVALPVARIPPSETNVVDVLACHDLSLACRRSLDLLDLTRPIQPEKQSGHGLRKLRLLCKGARDALYKEVQMYTLLLGHPLDHVRNPHMPRLHPTLMHDLFEDLDPKLVKFLSQTRLLCLRITVPSAGAAPGELTCQASDCEIRSNLARSIEHA